MELASGFVLAVIIGAVLLADRLGGGEQVARRFYQIALAGALALTVVAGTNAIVLKERSPELLTSSSNVTDFSVGNRLAIAAAIHLVAGVVGIIVGLDMMRRFTTVPLAILLGGLLLVLSLGQAEPLTQYAQLFGNGLQAERGVRFVNFLAVAGGSIALLAYGFSRWERDVLNSAAADDEAREDDAPGIP